MRGLLVGNLGDGDPGLVGARLESHGYVFERVDRDHPSTWPEDLGGIELVVVLGSEWSVYWPHRAAEVEAEAGALADAHHRRIPILAICYGSQIVAQALGGTVRRAERPEIGWFTIDTVDDAPPAMSRGPWMQWHSDIVDPPPQAKVLAKSDVGPQAWRLGSALCVQFHPEVTGEIVERWVADGAEEARAAGCDPDRLIVDSYPRSLAATPATNALVDWFCAEFAAGTRDG